VPYVGTVGLLVSLGRDALAPFDFFMCLSQGRVQPLPLHVVEIVPRVHDEEVHLAAIGKVDWLVDDQPTRLHTTLERERQGARVPPEVSTRHPL
jgi:hypothetical protein